MINVRIVTFVALLGGHCFIQVNCRSISQTHYVGTVESKKYYLEDPFFDSWAEASDGCKESHDKLATMKTEKEAAFFKKLSSKMDPTLGFWVDGQDGTSCQVLYFKEGDIQFKTEDCAHSDKGAICEKS